MMNNGGCITHILHVKLSPTNPAENPPSAQSSGHVGDNGIIYNQIYRAISQKIHDKKIIKRKNGVDIAITWFSFDDTHTRYYTDVKGLIGDIGVKRHTTELFYEILETLDAKFKDISVKLDFDVIIPLSCNSGYLPQVFGKDG